MPAVFVFRTSDKKVRYEEHYYASKNFAAYSVPARQLFDAKRARLTREEDAQEAPEMIREVDEPETGQEEDPFADDEASAAFENEACFANAPRLTWDNCLTYGTEIVGEIVDEFLDAYERYTDWTT